MPIFNDCAELLKFYFSLEKDFDGVCDGFVRTTDEKLKRTYNEPKNLIMQAGDDMVEELIRLEDCPTGEVRVTKAYDLLFAKKIIHAVAPLYAPNFHTASLSALHSVYKNTLNAAIEYRIKTLVIPAMFILPGDFPEGTGCHMVVRTLRRYFDHFGPEPFLESVTFSCPNEDLFNLYKKILPLYFPRNKYEEKLSVECNVPPDDGFGGPLLKERVIDIKVLKPNRNEDDDSDDDGGEQNQGAVSLFGTSTAPPSDHGRLGKLRRNSDVISALPVVPKTSFAKHAMKADFKDLVSSGFLNMAGTDRHGRHVLVFTANKVDLSKYDLAKMVLYFARVLLPIISNHRYFIVIYFHTETNPQQVLSIEQASFIIKQLSESSEDFFCYLHQIFCLHLDWKAKLSLTYAGLVSLPRNIYDKISIVRCSQTLCNELLPIVPSAGGSSSNGVDALLPKFVIDFDENDHTDHRE